MAKPIQIIIGSGGDYDPGVGETDFVIPSLDGAQFFVEKAGMGSMPYASYESLTGGGFRLLGGLTTAVDEVYFVHVVASAVPITGAGDYTNGFNHDQVIASLKDRIGFRQPTGAGAPVLTTAVTTSQSGRYFQDFHALVTVENIKACMELPSASDAQLIIQLAGMRDAAILRALNGVFTAPQVIDQPRMIHRREGTNDVLEPKSGRFVGYQIRVSDTPDAAVQIDSLQLYFNQAATFNVYLFKDGDPVAVWDQEVTAVANTLTDVPLDGKVLNRGLYYLGYFENDLGSVSAYRQQVCDEDFDPCYYDADPITADATGATTFNRDEISESEQPIGLNLEISSFKDYTTAIRRKAAAFDELIGLTLAYSTIENMLYSARSNATERILKDQLIKVGIQMDLNGAAPVTDSPQITGLRQRIDRETRRVKQSFYPAFTSKTGEIC